MLKSAIKTLNNYSKTIDRYIRSMRTRLDKAKLDYINNGSSSISGIIDEAIPESEFFIQLDKQLTSTSSSPRYIIRLGRFMDKDNPVISVDNCLTFESIQSSLKSYLISKFDMTEYIAQLTPKDLFKLYSIPVTEYSRFTIDYSVKPLVKSLKKFNIMDDVEFHRILLEHLCMHGNPIKAVKSIVLNYDPSDRLRAKTNKQPYTCLTGDRVEITFLTKDDGLITITNIQ